MRPKGVSGGVASNKFVEQIGFAAKREQTKVRCDRRECRTKFVEQIGEAATD